jgi:type II secretory pathway component PulM
MGTWFRQLDSRTRRLMALGNACLAVGLMLYTFVHPSSQGARDLTQRFSGLLLGVSIWISLFALRFARRCS